MIRLICFHDLAVEIQISALLVVLAMVACLLTLKGFWGFGLDSHRVEFIWTIVPFLIIIVFAVPSLVSLYLLASTAPVSSFERGKSKQAEDSLTIVGTFFDFFSDYNPSARVGGAHTSSLDKGERKVVLVTGRQWYWDYGTVTKTTFLSRFGTLTSSHMLNTRDVFHLLQLDQWLYLPLGEGYTFSVTSGDVLHSFAIPTLGIKIDAVPGKDNSIFCSPIIPGLYYGNCSEICGVNHSVMPIGIVVDNSLPRKTNLTEFWSMFSNSVNFLKERLINALSCTRYKSDC